MSEERLRQAVEQAHAASLVPPVTFGRLPGAVLVPLEEWMRLLDAAGLLRTLQPPSQPRNDG